MRTPWLNNTSYDDHAVVTRDSPGKVSRIQLFVKGTTP